DDNDGDVVDTAVAVRDFDEAIADALRVSQFTNHTRDRGFRDHAGQAVAAQDEIGDAPHRHLGEIDVDLGFTAQRAYQGVFRVVGVHARERVIARECGQSTAVP